jgi:hypothetical protein
MLEKRYCFVPDSHKEIKVLQDNKANVVSTFKYCIDTLDRIKLFYVDGREAANSMDDENFFKIKTITAIKSIFKVTELYNYKLILEKDARVEFSIFFDVDGNEVTQNKLADTLSKRKTVLEHRYTYHFFKRYN